MAYSKSLGAGGWYGSLSGTTMVPPQKAQTLGSGDTQCSDLPPSQ